MNAKERITEIRQQLLAAMSERNDTLEDMHARMNDQCLITLGKAVQLLNDARIQSEHPTVKRGIIAYFESSEHIHAQIEPYRFACGIEPGMNDRVTPGEGVPNCPECLAILEAQAENKMRKRQKN